MSKRSYRPKNMTRLETLKWLKKHRCRKVRLHTHLKGKCWMYTGALASGYGCVNFEGRMHGVHRLSLEQREGCDLEPGEQANHRCDNKACFNPDHLYVGTQQDNMADMVERGRSTAGIATVRGEDNGMSRFTEEKVIRARYMHDVEGHTIAHIARMFEVDSMTISRIVKRITWRHVRA